MSNLRLPPDEIALWSDRARGELQEAMRALYELVDDGQIDSVMQAFQMGQAYERMRSADDLMLNCQRRANHFAGAERQVIEVFATAARFAGGAQ